MARLDPGTQPAQQIRKFRKWASELEWPASRIDLAIYRALDNVPLSIASGGIERQWGELTPAEKGRLVRLSLECEKIILNRSLDDERARQLYGTAPVKRAAKAIARDRVARGTVVQHKGKRKFKLAGKPARRKTKHKR